MVETVVTSVSLVAAVVAVAYVFARWLREGIRDLRADNREIQADVKRILERLPPS